ncbi:gonadotropin-releasing hormone II receptor [Caerostris extrusa]|uniref:Gonadotropin-releasing hormone II receptor n=1 Tax=Caerostris extrusa TaxID=172846 RepID=A0AAV4WCX9_CAEEX|nr:gonadotropin-releasing hormone II receptor [Caerostris extrusa]
MDEGFTEVKISNKDDNYINKSYIKFNKSTYNESFAYPDLPYQFTSNEDAIKKITFRILILIFAACGNLLILAILIKNRHQKSRVYMMLFHLIISDLIVAFVTIPIEMSWMISVQWEAGNAACKIMFYVRAFGSYLSSMVGACISLDKYFAVVYPLKFVNAHRRSKIMLGVAWAISIICSIPQSIIFHVEDHLEYPQFIQCGVLISSLGSTTNLRTIYLLNNLLWSPFFDHHILQLQRPLGLWAND